MKNANGNPLWNSNYATKWKWCSGTISTSDSKEGNAVEISTLALYNQRVSGTYNRDKIVDEVKKNGTVYVGYLLYGTYDLSSDTYTLGKDHLARPVSMSFDYKYAPVAGDQCIAYAKLYDVTKQEIASTENFYSDKVENYTTQTLRFTYSDLECQAAFIGVFFQSGTDVDINKIQLVEGSYSDLQIKSPYTEDKMVGSILKVDNIKLNYEYE